MTPSLTLVPLREEETVEEAAEEAPIDSRLPERLIDGSADRDAEDLCAKLRTLAIGANSP